MCPGVAFFSFRGGSVLKNLPANVGDARDAGLTPGSGRSPGEGPGNPRQCSCLENPMDSGAWRATVLGVAQSRTQVSTFAHAKVKTPEDEVCCQGCQGVFIHKSGEYVGTRGEWHPGRGRFLTLPSPCPAQLAHLALP